MNTTEKIKNYIMASCDIDMVGIASADCLAGEPEGHRPADILPGAKNVIVMIRRITNGVVNSMFRFHENKKAPSLSGYTSYGDDLAANFLLVNVVNDVVNYLEDNYAGAVAVPVPFNVQQGMEFKNVPGPYFADPYGQGMPLNIFKAAQAAGLGEIGWSNRFVTEKYGPRVNIAAVITNMDLKCDEPFKGKLCDPEKCQICVKVCPTCALPAYKEGDGKVADINANACQVASVGYRKEFVKRLGKDLIQGNDPTDEELAAAWSVRPITTPAVEHYPRNNCDKCLIYCPLGDWNGIFRDRGLSNLKLD